MSFNDLNSVEHFIIHQLTGVNLNVFQDGIIAEGQAEYGTVKWRYVQSELLQRAAEDILLEKELTERWSTRHSSDIRKFNSSIFRSKYFLVCNACNS